MKALTLNCESRDMMMFSTAGEEAQVYRDLKQAEFVHYGMGPIQLINCEIGTLFSNGPTQIDFSTVEKVHVKGNCIIRDSTVFAKSQVSEVECTGELLVVGHLPSKFKAQTTQQLLPSNRGTPTPYLGHFMGNKIESQTPGVFAYRSFV